MCPVDTRTALISAAAKLFSSRGYEAVSTREIADTAGVNLGAIQYHFGSKSTLFIEMVRSLMHTTGSAFRELEQLRVPQSKVQAGIRLTSFISAFLSHSVDSDSSEPNGCKMMCREVLATRPNDDGMFDQLIDAVVSEFTRPFHQCLVETLRVLTPSFTDEALSLAAHSIAGQCVIYTSHGPFLEKLHNKRLNNPSVISDIARHITVFSLRGLGCEEKLIAEILSHLDETIGT